MIKEAEKELVYDNMLLKMQNTFNKFLEYFHKEITLTHCVLIFGFGALTLYSAE